MLESSCHQLDEKMAMEREQPLDTHAGTSYEEYLKKLEEAKQQELDAEKQESYAIAIQQHLTWLLLSQNLSQASAADLKYELNKALEKASTLVIHKQF